MFVTVPQAKAKTGCRGINIERSQAKQVLACKTLARKAPQEVESGSFATAPRKDRRDRKKKREHERICILLSPYIVYTDIWYIHPQALICHCIVYTIYALPSLFPCAYTRTACVCVCISGECTCHYPPVASPCVLRHHTSLRRACLKPQHHGLG